MANTLVDPLFEAALQESEFFCLLEDRTSFQASLNFSPASLLLFSHCLTLSQRLIPGLDFARTATRFFPPAIHPAVSFSPALLSLNQPFG